MDTTHDKHERGGELLSELGLDIGGLGDFDAFFRGANSDSESIDAIRQNSSGDGYLVNPDDLESPSNITLELNDTENSIIQLATRSAGKRRRGTAVKEEEKIYITHEDFEEGPERDAFLLIYGYAEHLFSDDNKQLQDLAIEFFFCLGSKEKLNFEDAAACIDTHIRIDVLRLRIMYEFWLREWHFILPFATVLLPSRIESVAAQYGDFIGIDVAREAWFEPGIEAPELIKKVSSRNPNASTQIIVSTIENLMLHHVISENTSSELTRFYTTGKNPILLQQESITGQGRIRQTLHQIHWSRLF